MKDHRMPFLGIGAASIVLVLTIVSLSVFATLTISSANGDYTLSQKNLERTTNYYKASNEVNCTLSQIDKKLWKNYHKTKNKKSYMKNISKSLVDLKGITYDKTKHTIQFQKSITSKQQINVKIRICYPEKQRNHCYEIKTKQLVHGRKMIHFQYFKENDQRGQNEHRRIFNIGGRERGIGSIYYCRITSYNENKWSNAPDQ